MAISAVVAFVYSIKSRGAMAICKPRTPALMYMVSCASAVECMYVGRGRFMPMGEQPPRIYPVVGSSSFMGMRSAFLFADMRAAAFRSTSWSPGMTHTKRPLRSPRSTRVLNTVAISSPSSSATCVAARSLSSTVYGTRSYAILALSKRRAALVLSIFFAMSTTKKAPR